MDAGQSKHTITARADIYDEVKEISEENNVPDVIVQVVAPPAFMSPPA